MKILLGEDDRAASVLKNTLGEHHYLVALAIGQAGLFLVEAFAYNLVRRSRAKSIWSAAIADIPQ